MTFFLWTPYYWSQKDASVEDYNYTHTNHAPINVYTHVLYEVAPANCNINVEIQEDTEELLSKTIFILGWGYSPLYAIHPSSVPFIVAMGEWCKNRNPIGCCVIECNIVNLSYGDGLASADTSKPLPHNWR